MSSETTGPAFEVADVIEALKRRARLIGSIALPIVVLGLTVAFALPDVYRSSAFFELEQNTALDASRYARSEYAEHYIYSLRDDVLNSDGARKLAEELSKGPGGGETQRGHEVEVEMVTARILDPSQGIERDINTGFVLSYKSRDPGKAFKGASWFTEAMSAAARENRARKEQDAASFLAEQADRAREGITESESRLADFKRRNIGRLPELAGSNLDLMERTQQELNSIEQQLAGLRQTQVYLAEQVQQLQDVDTGPDDLRKLKEEYQRKSAIYSADHPDVLALRRQIEGLDGYKSESTGRSLADELATRKATLAAARQRYSDDHPDVRRLSREIEGLEARIEAGDAGSRMTARPEPILIQSRGQLGAADSQIRSLERRRIQLTARIGELQSRIAATPEVEKNYWKLTRDLDNARKVYDELMNQKMEGDIRVAAAIRGRGDEFRIVGSPQRPNKPSEPARLAIALACLIVAAVVALSGGLLAEMVDSKVRGTRDLLRVIGTAPLAVVPEIVNTAVRERRRRELRFAGLGLLIVVPLIYLGMRTWLTA